MRLRRLALASVIAFGAFVWVTPSAHADACVSTTLDGGDPVNNLSAPLGTTFVLHMSASCPADGGPATDYYMGYERAPFGEGTVVTPPGWSDCNVSCSPSAQGIGSGGPGGCCGIAHPGVYRAEAVVCTGPLATGNPDVDDTTGCAYYSGNEFTLNNSALEPSSSAVPTSSGTPVSLVTYGDHVGGWMQDDGSGIGLWTVVPLGLAVLVIAAGVVILVRAVKTGTDAV